LKVAGRAGSAVIEIFLGVKKIDGQKNEEENPKNVESQELLSSSFHPVLNSMTILQEKSSLRRVYYKKWGKQGIESMIIRHPPCSRSGSSRRSRGALVGAAELADLTLGSSDGLCRQRQLRKFGAGSHSPRGSAIFPPRVPREG
jgi:hypothetical protein